METIAETEAKEHNIKFKFSAAHAHTHEHKTNTLLLNREWASAFCADARYMNPSSDAQVQQLFFAPSENIKTGEVMPYERLFDIDNTEGVVLYLKITIRTAFLSFSLCSFSSGLVSNLFSGIPDPISGRVKKKRQIRITGFELKPIAYTQAGWPGVGAEVLKKLAGEPYDVRTLKLIRCLQFWLFFSLLLISFILLILKNPPRYGTAYERFTGGAEGAAACKAIHSLVKMNSIETLLNTFIVPLQHQTDENSR